MFKQLPRGILALASIEMCERFSFYTVQALLVLYANTAVSKGGLGWSKVESIHLTNVFVSLAYITPIVGGVLADGYIGRRNAINIGSVMMCVGDVCLAASVQAIFYLGIGLLILGCGLLKPAISAMVGTFYDEDHERRDTAFAIFYMAINIGAVLGSFIGGIVSVYYSYHIAFLMAALSLFFALIHFYRANKYNPHIIDLKPTISYKIKPVITRLEKTRIKIYIMMCIGNVPWFIVNALPYGLLTLYAQNNMMRTVDKFTIPASWFYGMYAVFVVILSPLFTILYNYLTAKQLSFPLCYKLAYAYFLMACGALVILPMISHIAASPTYQGKMLNFILFYMLLAASSLLTIPVLLSAATRFAPKAYTTAMVATYMLISWGLGNYLGGEFSTRVTSHNAVYLFITIIVVTTVMGILHIMFNKKIEVLCQPSDNITLSAECGS